jgi:hypothetical protein
MQGLAAVDLVHGKKEIILHFVADRKLVNLSRERFWS